MANGYTETAKSSSVMESIHDEMVRRNNYMSELISSIKGKCHEILDLRGPEKESGKSGPVAMQTDFSQRLSQELTIMMINEDKLRDILDHLNKIV